MAIVVPVIVLLVFGMVEASRVCVVAQKLQNAARDGCRVAATAGETPADVASRVNATLDLAKIPHAKVTILLAPSNIEATKVGDPIALTVSVAFKDVNWLPSPFFFKTTTVTAGATMSSERP